jgi:hypothetical protein
MGDADAFPTSVIKAHGALEQTWQKSERSCAAAARFCSGPAPGAG